jgi:transcription-repair coupling factor (superfamily II helicase)
LLKRLWIELLEYDGKRLSLLFHAATPVSPEQIRQLVTDQAQRYRLGSDYRLIIEIGRHSPVELLVHTRKELQQLV